MGAFDSGRSSPCIIRGGHVERFLLVGLSLEETSIAAGSVDNVRLSVGEMNVLDNLRHVSLYHLSVVRRYCNCATSACRFDNSWV